MSLNNNGDHIDVPQSYREIALHLRGIRGETAVTNNRLTNLERKFEDSESNLNERMDNLEDKIDQRRFRLQDMFISCLLLPVVGGMLLYLLTKALGA
jgi:hypothetical protein